MISNNRRFYTVCICTTILAFTVVLLGAYTRLSESGLGCPDWPGCYGSLIVDSAQPGIDSYEGFDVGKAWREMIHRYLAAILGLGIFGIALRSWCSKSSIRAFSTETLLVPLVLFQAILGMFTVTWLLKPLVVTAHLLGGLAVLSLLWWSVLEELSERNVIDSPSSLKVLGCISFVVLFFQIFLGGWTSTNYAALACTDFPTCQGVWVPPANWQESFTLWRGLGRNYEYGILDSGARTAIHFTHRVWALVTTVILSLLVIWSLLYGRHEVKIAAIFVGLALIAQVTLGISNVLLGLPLTLAVAHNGGACVLLLAVITLLFLTVRDVSLRDEP